MCSQAPDGLTWYWRVDMNTSNSSFRVTTALMPCKHWPCLLGALQPAVMRT